MADVQKCGWAERYPCRRHDEAAVRPAKRIDHGINRLRSHASHGGHVGQQRRRAGIALAHAALGQAAEHEFGDGLLRGGECVQRLVGMIGQRAREATQHLVVAQRDMRRLARLACPRLGSFPHAHQGVLEQRQLVRVGTEIIEQPVHQGRFDAAAEHPCRPGNREPALLTREARGKVLAVVH